MLNYTQELSNLFHSLCLSRSPAKQLEIIHSYIHLMYLDQQVVDETISVILKDLISFLTLEMQKESQTKSQNAKGNKGSKKTKTSYATATLVEKSYPCSECGQRAGVMAFQVLGEEKKNWCPCCFPVERLPELKKSPLYSRFAELVSVWTN